MLLSAFRLLAGTAASLPFLLGVALLFLLLLGAGAALGPRRLVYRSVSFRFVAFVFQLYFRVCGLYRATFLLVYSGFVFILFSLHY